MAPRILGCLTLSALLGCAGGGKGGTTGSGGTSSSPGSAGTSGAAGTTGAAGTSGAAGTTGTAGTGTSGTAGTIGAAGTTGAAGATGTAGTSGTAGTTGAAGTTGSGGSSNTDAGTDMVCQTAEINWQPKIPTVFILVDRSGSEFDPSSNGTTGIYFNLRTAVLQVLQQLKTSNTQMRLGLGLFVGNHGGSTCMPVFDSVPIDDIANNYAAITAKYNSLAALQPPGTKAETPMSDIIPMVKALLQADTGTGQKYMLVATDGQTDFCDDGNNVCPADAIAYRVQDMYAATPSIGTLVLGLPTDVGGSVAFNTTVLQNLANAGAGQNPTLSGLGVTTGTDVYNQCNGAAGWKAIMTAAAIPASMSLATYGTPAGTAKVFTPSSTSTTDLANQIAAAISGIKSCTFDLSDIGGKSIKVDTTKLAQAQIKIMGNPVQLDATNGWNVDAANPTQLVLNGNACTTWRLPANTQIDFNFPCSSIIFE